MKTRSGKPVHLIGYEELLSVPTIAGASDIPLEQLFSYSVSYGEVIVLQEKEIQKLKTLFIE